VISVPLMVSIEILGFLITTMDLLARCDFDGEEVVGARRGGASASACRQKRRMIDVQ
jgi:hypothetical protein